MGGIGGNGTDRGQRVHRYSLLFGQLVAVNEQSLIVLRSRAWTSPAPGVTESEFTADPAGLYEIGFAEIAQVDVPAYLVPFRDFSEDNLARLRTYAAYPGVLNADQRRELLARYGQADFLKVTTDAPSDDQSR